MPLRRIARRMLLHPSRTPIDCDGADRRLVPCGGRELEAWVRRTDAVPPGEAPRGFVLCFTGNAGRAERVLQRNVMQWRDQPVEVWSVNYPGYGGSPGEVWLHLVPPVALGAFDALAAEAVGRPVFLAAASFGSAAALHVARQRPGRVAGLLLQNPPPLRQLIVRHYGWWNAWLLAGMVAWQVPRELDSIANAAQVDAPAAFIVAEADEVVPPAFQRRIVDAYAGPKRLIRLPGHGHHDQPEGARLDELRDALAWLWNTVPAGR